MAISNEGLTAIQLNMTVQGNPFVVYPTLIWDDNDVILVDTGIPDQIELIRAVLEQESTPLEKLTKIIITHHDLDHIGSLPELLNASQGRIQVLAHENAVPYLAGEIPLVKRGILAPPVKVDVTLKDGDILPYAGGIQVIFTPGHCPDHISLYHVPSRTLIAGDALTSHEGVLQSFNPIFTPDQRTALQSIAKLQKLEIEKVITYHGGVCKDNIKKRLQEILETTTLENE